MTYWAEGRLAVERSGLEFNQQLPVPVLVAAVASRPEWCPVAWPAMSGRPARQDLERFALLKLELFFAFAAKLEAESAAGLRWALTTRFPALGRPDIIANLSRYATFRLHATIWDDARCDGGATSVSDGRSVPLDATELAGDVFLKNVARIDLRERYEVTGAVWPE